MLPCPSATASHPALQRTGPSSSLAAGASANENARSAQGQQRSQPAKDSGPKSRRTRHQWLQEKRVERILTTVPQAPLGHSGLAAKIESATDKGHALGSQTSSAKHIAAPEHTGERSSRQHGTTGADLLAGSSGANCFVNQNVTGLRN